MCLHCGYYRGRQVMDLEGERAKREARIKAKHDRIRAESGVADTPGDVRREEEQQEALKPDDAPAKIETSKEKREESEKHSVKDTK